jgi:DNA-binding CsgD family transcriptional regulator
VALLLVLPIPAVLLLAPLLVPGDRIDFGFWLIDTHHEAWLAAIPGAILVLAIGVVTVKITRRQHAWVIRQVTPPETTRAEPTVSTTDTGLRELTEREAQVLDLMSQGFTNGAIAQELFISESTVRKHVGRIFAKLDVDAANNDRRVRAVLTYVQTPRRGRRRATSTSRVGVRPVVRGAGAAAGGPAAGSHVVFLRRRSRAARLTV